MNVYFFTDLHGEYDLWRQIKEYVKPEDLLICGGDCIDRGTQGLQIMLEVMRRHNTIYLMGNHEHLMRECLRYIKDSSYESKFYRDLIPLWLQNGGRPTLDAISNLEDADYNFIVRKLSSLPYNYAYNNKSNQRIICCHAGYTPPIPKAEFNLIWNRDHFADPWTGEKEIIIHGHTPILYVEEDNNIDSNNVLIYCDGHKIDIDNCSHFSGEATLFNLDTFKYKVFKNENKQ